MDGDSILLMCIIGIVAYLLGWVTGNNQVEDCKAKDCPSKNIMDN